MLVNTQVTDRTGPVESSEPTGRLVGDTGSVIEELGWKGLMIAAALAAGATVAAVVAAWAGAIPSP